MQVKELKSEGLSYELEITIPANDIDARVDEKLKEVSETIRMPGFRAGKVPMSLVKQRYGKAVLGEVLEKAVNETSAQAMEDKKIRPAMQPKIEVKSEDFGEGNDLVYTVEVEMIPEIKIADLKGMKLEKLVAKVEDKQIDEALERIAAGNQASEEVTEKRGAKDGDIVVIDFHGRTADDNVAHEGMHAHGHNLKLGSGQFIPGFEEQLIGAKVGDKVEVKVKFPDEYGAADLAGREAIFDVDVNQLRQPTEAKIDDEFAKQLGMEDVAALRKAVEEQIANEYSSHSRMDLKKKMLDILDEKHEFEIPAGMLELEYQNIVDQVEAERKQAGEGELSEDEKAEYKEIAARRVRLGFVISEIGNVNEITIADNELQQAVIREAQKYPGQEREVFDYYAKNQQALQSLRAPLFEEKVVDFIVELADVSEKEVSIDDLMKALDDEAEAKPKKKAATKKSTAKKKDDGEKAEKKPAAKKKAPAKKKAEEK